MREKFRAKPARENPAKKKTRARGAPGRRRRKAKSSRRRRAIVHKVTRRAWIVEVFKEARGRPGFVYWTGRGFAASRARAKIFKHEKEANKAAHAAMKRRPASYRFARVVPA